jgi:hypothetical protein
VTITWDELKDIANEGIAGPWYTIDIVVAWIESPDYMYQGGMVTVRKPGEMVRCAPVVIRRLAPHLRASGMTDIKAHVACEFH